MLDEIGHISAALRRLHKGVFVWEVPWKSPPLGNCKDQGVFAQGREVEALISPSVDSPRTPYSETSLPHAHGQLPTRLQVIRFNDSTVKNKCISPALDAISSPVIWMKCWHCMFPEPTDTFLLQKVNAWMKIEVSGFNKHQTLHLETGPGTLDSLVYVWNQIKTFHLFLVLLCIDLYSYHRKKTQIQSFFGSLLVRDLLKANRTAHLKLGDWKWHTVRMSLKHENKKWSSHQTNKSHMERNRHQRSTLVIDVESRVRDRGTAVLVLVSCVFLVLFLCKPTLEQVAAIQCVRGFRSKWAIKPWVIETPGSHTAICPVCFTSFSIW